MTSAPIFAIIVALAAPMTMAAAAPAARPTMAEYKSNKLVGAAAVAAAKANEDKMSAVNKVVAMLGDLQKKVLAEGDAESRTHQEVCRMCETSKKGKAEAIKVEKDEKSRLSASIKKLETEKAALDKAIKNNEDGIAADEKSIKTLKSVHASAAAVYRTNKADMGAAVTSLGDALKVMKSSMSSASLLQVQSVGKTVQHALLLADALGLSDLETQKTTSFLLQQDSHSPPAVEMEDFKFHSSGIIGTLEKLQADFRTMAQDVNQAEVKRVHKFNMQLELLTNSIKEKTHEMQNVQMVARNEAIEDIGTNSQELKAETALLRDDTMFLDSMNTMCNQKEKTYNQRLDTRQNELFALSKAVAVIKTTVAQKTGAATVRFVQTGVVVGFPDAVAGSESAMEAIEAEAEAGNDNSPMGFLQKRAVQIHRAPENRARDLVLALFKNKGQELHSVMLSELAANIAVDPFAKIKKLVQELIERQLAEAGNEANQKGWCDKANSDAEQKRGYAADDIRDLNARMSKLSALSDQLSDDISDLTTEIKNLNDEAAKATADRKDEKANNAQIVRDATEGKAAIEGAMDTLNQFYGTAANQADKIAAPEQSLDVFKRIKNLENQKAAIVPDCKKDCTGMTKKSTEECEVAEASCIQTKTSAVDDALDVENAKAKVAKHAAGNGQDAKMDEAYAGESAAATGIIGMMEVIQGDFDRTVSETKAAEEDARKMHLEFLTVTESSLAEKTTAKSEKTKQKNDADDKYDKAQESLNLRSAVLATSIKELMQLKKACQPKGESYADRVAKRQHEVESLTKGICILNNMADPTAQDEC